MPVDAELPCGADEASPFREAASTWLSGQPNGPRRVGFPWQPLAGVVRISTYEKTLGHPLTPNRYPRNLVSDARFCGVRWINPAASP